jgi:hypothetical protein
MECDMEYVPNTSDAELIQRVLDGETEAFAWIVKRPLWLFGRNFGRGAKL